MVGSDIGIDLGIYKGKGCRSARAVRCGVRQRYQ